MSASMDTGVATTRTDTPRPPYDPASQAHLPNDPAAPGSAVTGAQGALGSPDGPLPPVGSGRSADVPPPAPNPDLALDPPGPDADEMGQAEAAKYLAKIMEDFIMQFGAALAGLNDDTAGTMRDLALKAAEEAKAAAVRMIRYASDLLRKVGKWASMVVGVVIAVAVAVAAVKVAMLTGGAAVPVAIWACAAAATQVAELIATMTYDIQGKDGLPDAWEKGGGRMGMGALKMDVAEFATGAIELGDADDEAWASWLALGAGILALCVAAKGATKYLDEAAKASTELGEKLARYSSVIVKTQVVSGLKGALFTGVEGAEKYEADLVQASVSGQQAESTRLNGHAEQASERYKEGVELGSDLIQQLTELMSSLSQLLTAYVEGLNATASTPRHA